jgi:hypothetical protein
LALTAGAGKTAPLEAATEKAADAGNRDGHEKEQPADNRTRDETRFEIAGAASARSRFRGLYRLLLGMAALFVAVVLIFPAVFKPLAKLGDTRAVLDPRHS